MNTCAHERRRREAATSRRATEHRRRRGRRRDDAAGTDDGRGRDGTSEAGRGLRLRAELRRSTGVVRGLRLPSELRRSTGVVGRRGRSCRVVSGRRRAPGIVGGLRRPTGVVRLLRLRSEGRGAAELRIGRRRRRGCRGRLSRGRRSRSPRRDSLLRDGGCAGKSTATGEGTARLLNGRRSAAVTAAELTTTTEATRLHGRRRRGRSEATGLHGRRGRRSGISSAGRTGRSIGTAGTLHGRRRAGSGGGPSSCEAGGFAAHVACGVGVVAHPPAIGTGLERHLGALAYSRSALEGNDIAHDPPLPGSPGPGTLSAFCGPRAASRAIARTRSRTSSTSGV